VARPKTGILQTLLHPLELALEFLQSCVCSDAPSIEPGSQERDPIAAIERFGLQLLDSAPAHASNSITEYALDPRISRMSSRLPGFCSLQSARASVIAQRLPNRRRLNLGLEVGDPLVVS